MLTIIGCGNPNRSDDGAGIAVARLLVNNPLIVSSTGVRVFDAGTAGMDVMFQARGSDALIIVDASDSGSEAGSIFCVPGNDLMSVLEPTFTTHDFRWDHALYAGKKIFREAFPSDIVIYLIEKQTLELGNGLSAPVAAAVDRVVGLILGRVRATHVPAVASICIKRGSFYLSAELYERYFHGLDSVAVVGQEGQIALMPLVHQGGGGLLVKVLNARGDRVIHAREFLLEQSLQESEEHELSVAWDQERAALVMANPNRAPSHGC